MDAAAGQYPAVAAGNVHDHAQLLKPQCSIVEHHAEKNAVAGRKASHAPSKVKIENPVIFDKGHDNTTGTDNIRYSNKRCTFAATHPRNLMGCLLVLSEFCQIFEKARVEPCNHLVTTDASTHRRRHKRNGVSCRPPQVLPPRQSYWTMGYVASIFHCPVILDGLVSWRRHGRRIPRQTARRQCPAHAMGRRSCGLAAAQRPARPAADVDHACCARRCSLVWGPQVLFPVVPQLNEGDPAVACFSPGRERVRGLRPF
jgi:hypothetical protein